MEQMLKHAVFQEDCALVVGKLSTLMFARKENKLFMINIQNVFEEEMEFKKKKNNIILILKYIKE